MPPSTIATYDVPAKPPKIPKKGNMFVYIALAALVIFCGLFFYYFHAMGTGTNIGSGPYSDPTGLTYAIQHKDPANCRKYYGNNTQGYYCEQLYNENVPDSMYPNDISQCQSMNSGPDDIYFKDNCFRGIAELHLDPTFCSNLSSSEQAACVVQIKNDINRKNNLCGPLFVNGNPPGASECLAYVESLHDVKVCDALTRAEGPEWEKAVCIEKANEFNSSSSSVSTSFSPDHMTDCGTTDYDSLEAQSAGFANSACFNKQFSLCEPAELTGITNGMVNTQLIVGKQGNQCHVTLTQSTQNSPDPAVVWSCLLDSSGQFPTSPAILQKSCTVKQQ